MDKEKVWAVIIMECTGNPCRNTTAPEKNLVGMPGNAHGIFNSLNYGVAIRSSR